jgi:hypothetical protein
MRNIPFFYRGILPAVFAKPQVFPEILDIA